MLTEIVARAPIFLLVAVRCFAMILTVPLLSMRNVPRVAKVSLAGFMAFLVLPSAYTNDWQQFDFATSSASLQYVMFIIGEGLIGIITGFYISIIFAAFSSAGQFFTFQMGFGASEVYDTLSQIENPIMGQFLNLIAMLVFLFTGAFQQLFLSGVLRSFQSLNSLVLVAQKEHFMRFLLSGLTSLFYDAMMIALPIVGTLFLVSVTMGLLSKAAPQMNLLSEGLPLSIMVAFFLLTLLLPIMCGFFSRSFDIAFSKLENLFVIVAPK
ncbi:MAG: flagellar biosynthetic protein FliR [Treponema sp.]|jgi:flagellar biosynthetic protein FliR|nr:flagellar biosynthetic protein FliR [Treponema sp.]